MRGGGAARTHQHEIARVITTLHRDAADAVHHVVVDDGVHAIGRAFDRDAERIRNLGLDRLPGLREIERQLAAQKAIRVEIAQHEVGVRRRRLRAALAVTGRPRLRARRLRADLDEAEGVDPADRAAARTQRFHLDHRHADAIAQEVDVLVEVGLPVLGERDVEGRATHVHRDHVLLLERCGDIEARLRSRRRAGIDCVDGTVRHGLADGETTVGLEVAHRLLGAERAEIGIHRRHIAPHHGGQIGVHHRG